MEPWFTIIQGSVVHPRPPISHHIRLYFEKFVTEHILKAHKIIIGGKWVIKLGITFVNPFPKTPEDKMALARNPKSISSEQTKLYELLISVGTLKGSDNPLLATIELIYEGLTLFFTTTFKKVKPAFMAELWKAVDLDYLLSLPYPAPDAEQKYVGD